IRCLRPASFSIRMPEPPHKSPIAFRTRTPKVSLPGREPSHSADAVALLTQQSASSTLKARPAKLHHAAANVDREDNHAPGSVSLAKNYMLDAPAVRQQHQQRKLSARFTACAAAAVNQEDAAPPLTKDRVIVPDGS